MAPPNDPTRLGSWLQILPDNSVAIRTGVADFGQGTVSTGFRQIVAEELRLPFDMVTEVAAGDTDRTPDGGVAAGFMSKSLHLWMLHDAGIHPDSPFGRNALNLQKVAAYAYAELVRRASIVLGVPVNRLRAADGVVSGGERAMTYAELVRDRPLDVKLELAGTRDSHPGLIVLGTPALVPVSEHRVIGTSCPNPRIPSIVRAAPGWVRDVRLPGMLHGRMVHPPSLGSTLITIGQLDCVRFPGAALVVQKNLVGVVSPDEWEAICAAQAVADRTLWTNWTGLSGHGAADRGAGLVEDLLNTEWTRCGVVPGGVDETVVDAALAAAPKTLHSFYVLPFYKHAPISPEITVADARSDGTTHIWTATQQPLALRRKIAAMLETADESVVVHVADGAGGFGRTTLGDAGPEAEAVLLSRACGRPVRLQWMQEEDFAWSTQQSPYLGVISVGLDDDGRMVAFKAEHHQPGTPGHPLLGALLAGLTPPGAPREASASVWLEWPYDRVPQHLDVAYGAPTPGERESPLGVGLSVRSMRSPNHMQQNFGAECAVNEAAAAAGADPIEYRIEHTSDRRLIDLLEAARRLAGWQTRSSPAPGARAHGGGVVRGRGIGVAIRHGGYFVGVAAIAVNLDSAVVTVEHYWVAVDVGFVVNPRQLQLNVEGGSVMGISQALHEELIFDRSAVTSTDFRSYPIMTMDEMPEIEVEILADRELMVVGQGSEPANMAPPVALAAAFFDATGVHVRRLPLRPEYVRAELRDAVAGRVGK